MPEISSAAASPTSADRLDPALLKLAGIVLVGAVAVQLDMTIVNVAIDTLGRDLHATLSTIQWVSTGYLLAVAVMIPLTGWAVDRFGSKPMWMLSLAFFLGGSVLCGVAWSAGSLIGFTCTSPRSAESIRTASPRPGAAEASKAARACSTPVCCWRPRDSG